VFKKGGTLGIRTRKNKPKSLNKHVNFVSNQIIGFEKKWEVIPTHTYM